MAKAVDYLIPTAEMGISAWHNNQMLMPIDQSWPITPIHAAAVSAMDANAQAAIAKVPAPMGGDLWPLLPVCVPAAIQPN